MKTCTQFLLIISLALAACGLDTPNANAQLPEAGSKALDYYLGTWRYEWEVEGNKYSGTWVVNRSPSDSCNLSHWSSVGPDGPAKGTKITGWNAEKRQIVDLEFSANGDHVLSRYTIASDEVEIGEGIGSLSDGKATRSRLRVDKKKDEFTWTLTDQVAGDERLPDLKFVFRRVAEVAQGNKALQSLEPLIGRWIGTANVGENETTARVAYTWMNQNRFVKQTVSLGDMEIVHIIGWDPTTNSLRTWGFGGQGGHGELAWTKHGEGSWKEESSDWVSADGKRAHFLLETKLVGDDLLIEGFFENDEKTKVEIKAQRAKASAPTAVQTWLKYLEGTWEFELNDGRKGEVSYQPSGKTPALVFHGVAGDFSILGVLGWRADLGMLVETDFHTQELGVNGNLNRTYTDITDKSVKGSGRFYDRTGLSGSQTLEYERVSDDEMELTGSESDSGGTSWVVKFKRAR